MAFRRKSQDIVPDSRFPETGDLSEHWDDRSYHEDEYVPYVEGSIVAMAANVARERLCELGASTDSVHKTAWAGIELCRKLDQADCTLEKGSNGSLRRATVPRSYDRDLHSSTDHNQLLTNHAEMVEWAEALMDATRRDWFLLLLKRRREILMALWQLLDKLVATADQAAWLAAASTAENIDAALGTPKVIETLAAINEEMTLAPEILTAIEMRYPTLIPAAGDSLPVVAPDTRTRQSSLAD